MNKAKLYTALSMALILTASYLLLSSGAIFIKAKLAQYLIEDAWNVTLENGKKNKPWRWADTYPVAKLKIAQQELYVLAGASGRTLAFGPAHLTRSVLPGLPGNSVIAGHKDTHFSLLKHINIGDKIEIESIEGLSSYTVSNVYVTDLYDTDITNNTPDSRLTLITCYPFDPLSVNSNLRYVVEAVKTDLAVFHHHFT